MCKPNKQEEKKLILVQFLKKTSTVNNHWLSLISKESIYLFKWHCTEIRPNLYCKEIPNGPHPNRKQMIWFKKVDSHSSKGLLIKDQISMFTLALVSVFKQAELIL